MVPPDAPTDVAVGVKVTTSSVVPAFREFVKLSSAASVPACAIGSTIRVVIFVFATVFASSGLELVASFWVWTLTPLDVETVEAVVTAVAGPVGSATGIVV